MIPALVLALLVTITAISGPPSSLPLTVNAARTVVVAGPIARGNLEPLGLQILEWSRLAPAVPIDIVIDSPGGDVYTGFQFINQMEAVRARGTQLRCFVPTLAASMAFQILLHCDVRYTLDHAFLLWHGVRVFGTGGQPLTAPGAAELARELATLDRAILRELHATLGLPPEVVQFHFQKETLHIGHDLAELAPTFIQSRVAIPGLEGARATGLHPEAPEGPGDVFTPGQVVYIWSQWAASAGGH